MTGLVTEDRPMRECAACGMESPAGLETCPYCGYEFPDPKPGVGPMAWLFALLMLGPLLWAALRLLG